MHQGSRISQSLVKKDRFMDALLERMIICGRLYPPAWP